MCCKPLQIGFCGRERKRAMPYLPPFGFVPEILAQPASVSQGKLWELITFYSDHLFWLRCDKCPRGRLPLRAFRRRSARRAGQIRCLTRWRAEMIELYMARKGLLGQKLLPAVLSPRDGRLQIRALRAFQKISSMAFWREPDPEKRRALKLEHVDKCAALESFYHAWDLFEEGYDE